MNGLGSGGGENGARPVLSLTNRRLILSYWKEGAVKIGVSISCLEVRVRQFLKITLFLAIISLAGSAMTALAGPEPRVMNDEIFDALARGYQNLSQSKFNDAQAEFEKVIKVDFDNPYANNNLAVLMEKQGKLVDAVTYLNIGGKVADHYLYQVATVYLLGGVCAAVNPEKATTDKSPVAQVIADNQKKLEEKLGVKPAETPKNVGK
jgi:hypothetical protein